MGVSPYLGNVLRHGNQQQPGQYTVTLTTLTITTTVTVTTTVNIDTIVTITTSYYK